MTLETTHFLPGGFSGHQPGELPRFSFSKRKAARSDCSKRTCFVDIFEGRAMMGAYRDWEVPAKRNEMELVGKQRPKSGEMMMGGIFFGLNHQTNRYSYGLYKPIWIIQTHWNLYGLSMGNLDGFRGSGRIAHESSASRDYNLCA